MAAANRRNAQKSTGPTSARGKDASRRNAGKHWGRAEVLRPMMPALGEDPEEFQAFLEGLRQTLAPRDVFEDVLVTDMAEIHWHLRRLLRGETGTRARSRRHQQAVDDAEEARLESGKLKDLEPFVVSGGMGVVGLTDSPPKFQQILGFLHQIDDEVQEKGFQDEGPGFLQCLYGKNPGPRGLKLITAYEVCLMQERFANRAEEQADDVEIEDDEIEDDETEDAGTSDDDADGNDDDEAGASIVDGGSSMADRGVHEPRSTNHDHALPPATDDRQPSTVNRQINYRAQFHKVIADEIAWFEERAARDRQARAELKVPSIEAALETDDKTRLSLINQERLDRLFERKWRLLARYRENGCR